MGRLAGRSLLRSWLYRISSAELHVALRRVRSGSRRQVGAKACKPDVRPDESTTNVGLSKAGTGCILEHVDQPLLTLVGPTWHRRMDRVLLGNPASSAAATPAPLVMKRIGAAWLNLASV